MFLELENCFSLKTAGQALPVALCLFPVAGQACLVVAEGPELLCGLHLAA